MDLVDHNFHGVQVIFWCGKQGGGKKGGSMVELRCSFGIICLLDISASASQNIIRIDLLCR
jgi:hypothetical protein